MDYRQHLLSLYDLLPFHEHPLWQGIFKKELSLREVLRAELQHYLRTKVGQTLRSETVAQARKVSPRLWEAILETYLEECTSDKTGPSHLDLIRRLLVTGGVSEKELEDVVPTPGNSAAMALYKDITERGAGCHMLGAGAVEHYYCKLSPRVYRSYIDTYGMTAAQAETYRIHGPLDAEHANRAFAILDEAIELHGWPVVERSVRDAFVATSLHYDGMLQAAQGKILYWNGEKS